MISDILSFKGFAGWTCGEDYASLTWDAAAAGRDKPTEAEIAAWKDDKDAAQSAIAAIAQSDDQAKAAGKSDTVIQYLVTHTPAECAAYVAANVNNLADAKAFLGKVAIALSVLARREFR